MKFLRILVLLCLTTQAFAQDKTAVFKLNLVKGESTVTTLPNKAAVEKILTDALTQKGYTVLTQSSDNPTAKPSLENLYLVDAFVYQFPADYPSITLSIRKNGYVFYLQHEYKKLFTDRQAATENLAKEVASRIPATLDDSRFLMPQLDHLLPAHIVSIYTAASGVVTGSMAEKYMIDISNSKMAASDFIID